MLFYGCWLFVVDRWLLAVGYAPYVEDVNDADEKVKNEMDCNKFISIQNQVHVFMYLGTTIDIFMYIVHCT